MAYIDVYFKNQRTSSVPLKESESRIGRKPDNEIVLPDLTVSRLHGAIHYVADGRYRTVENYSSKNPILLNGRPLRKAEILFDGDRIGVGAYVLLYHENRKST